MERREFLARAATAGLSLSALAACGGGDGENGFQDDNGGKPLPETPDYTGLSPFVHGVASGDPLPDRVIFWTRITADAGRDNIPVALEVALDSEFSSIVARAIGYAREDKDFTIKFDPLLPAAATTYYYRFYSLNYYSQIGRTLTTATGNTVIDRLRLAVVSCSNLPYGYFNAYAKIAKRKDLDAVLHLGDYIYEYGKGEYGDSKLENVRLLEPEHEILTLSDYRLRYGCYRKDADLQECHRQHPFICVWDDHEIANNAWQGGAENHNEGEGDYQDRKQAAVQAYNEWLPIRSVDPDNEERIYRSFEFGQLVSLIMLDTRLIGRDEQLPTTIGARDPDRQLLGREQEKWLYGQLDQSQSRGSHWHLLGQQVMLSPLTLGTLPDLPNVTLGGGGLQLNMDQWDGYEVQRRNLLQRIEAMKLDNVVVLTGDIHSSWAMDVSLDPGNPLVYNRFTGEGSLAVEFVTPAVTSPGIPVRGVADAASALLPPLNRHMKWVDFFYRGYVLLDITPERCKADWFHLEAIDKPGANEFFARSYLTRNGRNRLERADAPSAPKQIAASLAP